MCARLRVRVQIRAELSCREVAYVSLAKESHVLEAPEALSKKMPGSVYEVVGTRKGYKRWVRPRGGRGHEGGRVGGSTGPPGGGMWGQGAGRWAMQCRGGGTYTQLRERP